MFENGMESSQLKLCSNAMTALEKADVLAIVTEWPEFKNPDFALIKEKLRYPAIFDGRNLFDPNLLFQKGIDYFSIGRPERHLGSGRLEEGAQRNYVDSDG